VKESLGTRVPLPEAVWDRRIPRGNRGNVTDEVRIILFEREKEFGEVEEISSWPEAQPV
jgi:hypothetical protein